MSARVHSAGGGPAGGGQDPPSSDELLAMAFADGELSAEERLSFEQRMVHEEQLGRLVAEHMALDVLARRVAPKEPQDHEWERLRLNPLFSGSRSTGWFLLVLGSVLTLALTVFGVATNESLSAPMRVGILGALLGLLLLFITVAARRLRTLPLDPYRHVER